MKPLWTAKQAKALPLLASGMSGVATAQVVGCNASTISDWLNNNQVFVNELERLQEQLCRKAMDQIQGTLGMAVQEIQRILTTSSGDATRLKAAMFIIKVVASTQKSLQTATDPESLVELEQLQNVFAQLGRNHASQ